MSLSAFVLGRLSLTLLFLGVSLFIAFEFVPYDTKSRKRLRQYEMRLDRQLKLAHFELTGRQFIGGQTAAAVLCLLLLPLAPLVAVLLVPVIPLANVLLHREQARRITVIEEQLDGWVTALANALKSNPSIGDSIEATVTLVDNPIRQEIDLIVKEYHLGTPLDRALHNAGTRIGSRTVKTVLSTLVVARGAGGNLPETLERAAASLREMARLEGVVRTKTAEGKAQAWVISAIPIPLFFGIQAMMPEFYEPLLETFVGNLLLAAAVILWLSAALLARKILAVDI